jgi:hypothetical protein
VSGIIHAFFLSLVDIPLVRGGADVVVPGSNRLTVLKEMILQICRDYNGLPDVRTMDEDEIMFFYDGLRAELKEAKTQNG